MLNNKKKESCGSTPCKKRSFVWIAASTLAMLVISFVVTKNLPWKPLYEVRYEFRVRNFAKNVEGNERVMRNIDLRDSYWLSGYINSLPEKEGLSRSVRYDNTKKITVCVRGADSAEVSNYGVMLYETACDTMVNYGDSMCAVISRVLRDEIASLPDTLDDSLMELRKDMYEQLSIVNIDNATGTKYIELINGAELPEARKTMARGWVIVLSVAVTLLFCMIVSLLKKDDDESY